MICLKRRKILIVDGKDAIKIIHKLSTQNVVGRDNILLYSCFLSAKSRLLCDFFIYIISPVSVLIDVDIDMKDFFIDRIDMCKLGADVRIVSSKYKVYISNNKINKDKDIIVQQDPRASILGYRLYAEDIDENDKDIDTESYYDTLLKNKITDSQWMTPSKSIILEYNLHNLNAISKDKGCYPGQELIARTLSQGSINKKLFVFKKTESSDIKDSDFDILKIDSYQNNTKIFDKNEIKCGILVGISSKSTLMLILLQKDSIPCVVRDHLNCSWLLGE